MNFPEEASNADSLSRSHSPFTCTVLCETIAVWKSVYSTFVLTNVIAPKISARAATTAPVRIFTFIA
ncbi:MAG: hypothetical protein E6K56_00835 [Ignavibacteria bacterium]|nr:MAG: hypothetical protein E6K56_00835 [Ignavibacteria bacterium]